MCSGCRAYSCWNGVTFDCVEGGQLICDGILREIELLEGVEPAFLRKVQTKLKSQLTDANGELKRVERELAKVRQQHERISCSLLEGAKGCRTLTQTLMELEAREDQLLVAREMLLKHSEHRDIQIPPIEKLKELARETIGSMSSTPVLARQMQQLVPFLAVFPYRLADGGRIFLRAKAVINLTALLPEPLQCPELTHVFQRTIWIDLFQPPQREKFRKDVVALRKRGLTERQVAEELHLTITAAQPATTHRRRRTWPRPPAVCGHSGIPGPVRIGPDRAVCGPTLKQAVTFSSTFESSRTVP